MYTLSIDKMSTVFTIPENEDKLEHFQCLRQFMQSMASEGHKCWSLKYCKRLAISLGNSSTVMMQIGTSHQRLYAKFEFNPRKLDTDERELLLDYLSVLFDFGYHSLYQKGVVNYVELAADIEDAPFDGLFFYDERLNASNYAYEGSGTVYLGSKTGRKTFCVYDKAKQLKKLQGGLLGPPMTRIEARLSGLPHTLAQLHSLTNPFTSIHVGLKSKLFSTKGDGDWKSFQKRCQHMGVQTALVMSGKLRKKLQSKLLQVTSPELAPANCWSQFSGALSVIRPPAQFH